MMTTKIVPDGDEIANLLPYDGTEGSMGVREEPREISGHWGRLLVKPVPVQVIPVEAAARLHLRLLHR